MNTYIVTFTIKQTIHPLQETVQAETVEQAKEIVRNLIKQAGCNIKQIVGVVQQ